MNSQNPTRHTAAHIAGLACFFLFVFLPGCERSPEPQFRLNNVEWVKQERLALDDGEHFSGAYKTELADPVSYTHLTLPTTPYV